jgi:protein-L-isoaspartate(D-aspartate) O-methyltransferase
VAAEQPFDAARNAMVEAQIRARGVIDPRVLEAMAAIPRHLFVPPDGRAHAYDDHPLPIGHGQTISQPYMVARMSELCEARPGDLALEVGAGCGYQAAVLARLVRHVFAVEIVPELCALAVENLRAIGIGNVTVACVDGTGGWAEHAPYDVILVSAGAPEVPKLLVDQLSPDGGRLVIPVGERGRQRVQRVVRHGNRYETLDDTPCRFVDLVGRYGWGGPGAPRA